MGNKAGAILTRIITLVVLLCAAECSQKSYEGCTDSEVVNHEDLSSLHSWGGLQSALICSSSWSSLSITIVLPPGLEMGSQRAPLREMKTGPFPRDGIWLHGGMTDWAGLVPTLGRCASCLVFREPAFSGGLTYVQRVAFIKHSLEKAQHST